MQNVTTERSAVYTTLLLLGAGGGSYMLFATGGYLIEIYRSLASQGVSVVFLIFATIVAFPFLCIALMLDFAPFVFLRKETTNGKNILHFALGILVALFIPETIVASFGIVSMIVSGVIT